MRNFDYMNNLHFGQMLKEIVHEKQVSSKKLTEAFSPSRYQLNADKIFKLSDVDVEDAIRISKIIDFNLLDNISNTYLSNIPFTGSYLEQTNYSIILNLSTRRFVFNIKEDLEKIHIGKYIKKLVHNEGWVERDIANRMKCNPSLVSYYYKHESLKIKPLIHFSQALNYNLIAEVYLVRMGTISCIQYFDDCIIKLNTQQNHAHEQDDGTFTITFCPKIKLKPKKG